MVEGRKPRSAGGPALAAIRLAAMVVGATLAAAGCGSGDDTGSPATSSTSASTPSSTQAPISADETAPPAPVVSSSNQASAPEPTSTTVPPTTVPADGTCLTRDWVASLPLRDRIGQLVMVSVGAAATLEGLVAGGVGGVYLGTGQNGLADEIDFTSFRTPAGLPLWVATDEEGGRVQRLQQLDPLPSPRVMASTMSPEEVRSMMAEHARQMRALGITVDFAPVIDVSAQTNDEVIGDRSFSDDPAIVAAYGEAYARGLLDGGVLPVLKHFPGHGHASGDSHVGASTAPRLADLWADDLVPYTELLLGADAPLHTQLGVMVGHLDVPGLTEPGFPASISPAAMTLLRDDFAFEGVVFTDELGAMRAIADRYGLLEATRRAIAVGADQSIWIDPGAAISVVDHLESSVQDGTLDEIRVTDAAYRVLAAKEALGLAPCGSEV